MILDTVELFLAKYDLLKPKTNIIVAFSGGYDSMCLLDVMKQLSQKHNLNLYAIHLNHNWRGKESDLEEQNCKNYCNNITFYSETLSSEIPHTETAAREVRYAFFEKCAKKFNSKVILTAHNANDNAETIFYRLMKGTGITGLEGIQEHRDIYYRPILSVYRTDIEKYCNDNNLNPNNDSSNKDVTFARNKIRHEIFPVIKKVSPDFEQNLNNLSRVAQNTNKIIEKQIKKLEKYSTSEFCQLDDFIQSTVIHRFFRTNNLDYDRKKIEEIVNFININKNCKSGKTISLTTDKWLFVNNKKIETVNKQEKISTEIAITKIGKYEFADYTFEISPVSTIPEKYPKDCDFSAYIELKDEINFTLRGRLDGDTIHPLGLNGSQKLKKYLNEKKIPKHIKDNLVLLCKNKEVMWVAGVGLNEKIKVVNQPTHIIKLRRGK